jgi:hypothetical protein
MLLLSGVFALRVLSVDWVQSRALVKSAIEKSLCPLENKLFIIAL